ncbi:MAG: hypothetical protein D6683_00555 [Actinomyces sp.]|nr:MAG: hypothetical protein D6683_00555 [Actinomyces sp.]
MAGSERHGDAPRDEIPTADADCDHALHELDGYLDGALTIERRTVISAHVDECGHCYSAYAFHIELRRLIARGCREEVPPSLVERVQRLLEDAARGDGHAGDP